MITACNKIYKSKISYGLLVFLIVLMSGALITTSIYPPHWLGILINLPPILFIIHLFSTTYYSIKDEKLTVHCSFFTKVNIDIHTISSVLPTKDISSAPALSFDRLKIEYDKNKSIIISPKDQAGFLSNLKEINALIETKNSSML